MGRAFQRPGAGQTFDQDANPARNRSANRRPRHPHKHRSSISLKGPPSATLTQKRYDRDCRRRIGRPCCTVLTLVAWLLATGTQWDVVQAVAWVRMFAENSRTMPFLSALDRTFSPEGRCEFCQAVGAAKEQQQKDAAPKGKSEGKPAIVFQPAPVVILDAPEPAAWLRGSVRFVSAPRVAPPLPHPRA